MTDFEPEAPSKSQEKREAAEISKLAERLCALKSSQLALIPYPNIIDAVTTYQKITKGNARKRQLGYISRQLRKLELSDVRAVVQRFDSSSPLHQTLIAKLEHYRTRLIESDTEVVAEISHHFPDVDRQHLMLLVRKAQRELSMTHAESGSDEESHLSTPSERPVSPSAGSKAVFSYLKTLADQHLTANAKQEFDA